MKRFIKVISFLFISSISFAGTMGTAYVDPLSNRFYMGGDIGVAGLVDKESHSTLPETHQLGSVGIIGGGYLGYELMYDIFGLGLEIFADGTGLNAAIKHTPYTYQHHQDYQFGIRILPEYAFNPTMSGHAILGYTNGGFSISDNGVYGYINKTYIKNGFQAGLGATALLNESFAVRLDAIYNIYASQTNIGLGLMPRSFQFYTNTFNTLAGELSLIYKFNL